VAFVKHIVLYFNYYIYFYATKCLFTLSAIKMLENSSRGLLPIQKLLYKNCILSIAVKTLDLTVEYAFQLNTYI